MKLRIIAPAILASALVSPVFGIETYQFDQSRSTIGFSVHQLLGTTHGKFTKFNGTFNIDREHPEKSSVTARIEVGSINTGIVKRDNHLRSSEFFNVAKYSDIAFKSRSVKQTGNQAGDVFGDLTMHGVTKPVTLHVRLLTSSVDSKQTRWEVTTEPLQRRDFHLMFSPTAEFLSGISQRVAIHIEVEATRAQ